MKKEKFFIDSIYVAGIIILIIKNKGGLI